MMFLSVAARRSTSQWVPPIKTQTVNLKEVKKEAKALKKKMKRDQRKKAKQV